jgi:uncharacterized LabA/DUF88 family protein
MQGGKNYAFIDSNNLHLGVFSDIYNSRKEKIYSGWKIDYKRFRIYLKDKYKIEKAFLFIGYKQGNQSMYTKLQDDGYICVFKPSLELKDGKIKGNVDAELVLHSMIEFSNYDKAVIVSGDGDFYCLIEYFINEGKLEKVLAPNQFNYSSLLDRLSVQERNIMSFVSHLKNKLEYRKKKNVRNEKGSRRDKTLREPNSS